MYALRRPKILVPLVVVLVALIVGFFAVKSRGDDNTADLKTTTKAARNCPPVARADVAATKPDESIAIDVLANDSDSDGDPLVFQILKTDGGTSSIDDGGTPTDSSDDRLLFTPGNPPPETATIEYQALDPQGGFSSSTVSVSINPTAALPEGAHSASITDPPAAGSVPARCAGSTPTTSSDDTSTTAGPAPGSTTTSVTATTIVSSTATTRSSSGSGSSGHHTTTTTKKKSTTTTAKKPTPTTQGGEQGTPPTFTPPTNPTTSTTKKPSAPPTTRPGCPDPTKDRDGFIECQKHGPTTTTTT